MNRQKLATGACIILSIVFSLSLGIFGYFKLLLPTKSEVYAKTLDYPENLYKEYQKAAEEMIDSHEYTCKYPTQSETYIEDGYVTLILKIGEYDEGKGYSNYVTATVKKLGTNEQEVTFERSRKSVEEACEQAEKYKIFMNIFYTVLGFILIIFTLYLIVNSIKKHYSRVLIPIIYIVALIVILKAMIHFLTY